MNKKSDKAFLLPGFSLRFSLIDTDDSQNQQGKESPHP